MAETKASLQRPGEPAAVSAPPVRSAGQRWRRSLKLRNVGEIGALVVLLTLFSVLNPHTFATLTNFRTILDQAAVPLIVGVGATLVILMGSIDLSVEGVMGAAGMTFVLLSANDRNSLSLGFGAIAIAIAVGVALGLVSGLIHTRLKVPSFNVTLGMWFVGIGIATILLGDQAIPYLAEQKVSGWPSSLTLGLPNDFVLAALVVAGGVVVTRYTRLGRFTYAIGDNEQIARDNGVHVPRFKLYVFLLAGACSALAGVVASMQLGAGAVGVGLGILFLTVAAVVIGGTSLAGGRGGVLRTVVGVFLLTVLNNGLILSGVSPNIQSGVSGAVLVVAIIAAGWAHRGRLRIAK